MKNRYSAAVQAAVNAGTAIKEVYGTEDFQAVIAELSVTSDPARRTELNQQAQTMIAEDYVNGYLFQLAKTGVANAKIQGLWENAPTQANDLTGVSWSE